MKFTAAVATVVSTLFLASSAQAHMVPLDTPIVTPTGTINTTVGSVTWANGNLPDNMYEDFGLQFKLPAMTGPLYWSVMQHCTNGAWNNWTNVPDAAGKVAGFPAAVITVNNATTTAGGPGAGATGAPDASKSGASSLQLSGFAVLAAVALAMF
ncbi:hypothetical protein BGZ74_004427 [Mortierella antarctica]|nr:hypothetical protein BGZ74_004427 [Mortierella antarctica]